jgi:hypothetical protein
MGRNILYYIGAAVFAFIMGLIILSVFSGCAFYNTNKVKHFYVEYNQKAFVHVPTNKKNTWVTYEFEAPEYNPKLDSNDFKMQEDRDNPDLIFIEPIE